MKPKLGIDLGNVIISLRNRTPENSFFGENFLKAPIVKDSFDRIRDLYVRFDKNAFIISKSRESNRYKNELWLEHNDFFAYTGIEKTSVFFCTQHIDKKAICENLGITHFVDDRMTVLQHLIGIVPNLYLFSPEEEEIKGFEQYLPYIVVVQNWNECYETIIKNIQS